MRNRHHRNFESTEPKEITVAVYCCIKITHGPRDLFALFFMSNDVTEKETC